MSHSDEEVYRISNIYTSKLKYLNDHRLEDTCARVRQEFCRLADTNPGVYDECDVERVRINEFTVKRYVLWNDLDFDKSLQQLDECMKWRKQIQINSKSMETSVPSEFYKAGAFFRLGVDRNGLPIVYMRGKTAIRIKKLQPIVQILAISLMNEIDIQTNGKGVVAVIDLYEVGLKNADLDMLYFIITTGRKYFPLALSRIIILNLPWYLKGLVPIVKMWLSDDELFLLKFASGQELFKYIDASQVPAHMGGRNTTDFTVVPEGCKPCIEMCGQYGITRAEATKYMEKYKHVIDEGQKLVECPEYYANKRKVGKELTVTEDQNNNTYSEDVSDSEVIPMNK